MPLATALTQQAQTLGFTTIGWTPVADAAALRETFTAWLADGRHGDMLWMARDPARRSDPRHLLDTARTLITVTCNYYTPHRKNPDPQRGWISRYAWGDDYHDVLLPHLRALLDWLRARDPSADGLAYVDTGPVLEKPWAARAGLGWQGKHTNLIDPKRGSWFFLGEIITTIALRPNERSEQSSLVPASEGAERPSPGSCGRCTRCIDVCPTQAITAPYQLDARRCIAYLTIELKGSIPRALRPLLGQHIYGCDLCQDVCPWNRFATPTPEPAFQPRPHTLNPVLAELMYLTDEQFRQRFRKSPIKRIKRRGLLRNVAVALGNSGHVSALPALIHGLHDHEPLIRAHAAWALHQLGTPAAQQALAHQLAIETDPLVRQEIQPAT